MKSDINLVLVSSPKRIHIGIFVILALIVLLTFAILIPIQHRNKLITEYQRLTRELESNTHINNYYLGLERYSRNLSRKIEILDLVSSKHGNIARLFNKINASISPSIEITEVSITGNVVTIRGTAYRDEDIANIMMKLQDGENIIEVKVREITLEKKNLRRVFELNCISVVNEPSLDGVLFDDHNTNLSGLGGEDN